jgi:hypothetical protein
MVSWLVGGERSLVTEKSMLLLNMAGEAVVFCCALSRPHLATAAQRPWLLIESEVCLFIRHVLRIIYSSGKQNSVYKMREDVRVVLETGSPLARGNQHEHLCRCCMCRTLGIHL